MPLMRKRI